ncbi:hypothetical protein BDV10DRAFT_189441 [Aspergillus recurvatus]
MAGKQCGIEDSTKGMIKIAQKQDNCYWGQVQHLCCPAGAAFQNCHWVGKGTCDDNECDDNDVQVDTATYGDSPGSCVGNSRKKVLCCDSPKNLNHFLPVDYPQFDLQNLGGNSVLTTDLNANTFGMIIIVGPEDTVQSLRRRDGSDLHVLDCGNIRADGRSHIRLVCPREFNSTCDKLHRGGVEGTILRMPEGCGLGSYTVLHALRPAPDRSLPYHIVRSASWDPGILETEISYDFGLVKRDSGDIYIRIGHSNSLGYWKSIVQGDPARKKHSSASDWNAKFNEVRNAGKSITRLGQGYLEKTKFDVLLSGETKDDCSSSSSDDGFLNMDISGTLHEELEFGYSFVGTISPNFNIEEAYGYYNTSLTLTGALNFNGKGYFSVPAGMAGANMFSSPVSAWGFSHPGICSFGPWANVEVHMTGEGEISGDFTANFIIGNDGAVTDSLPASTGSHSGGVSNQLLSGPFSGALTLPPSSSSSKKRQSSDATILALRFLTTSQMKLDLNFFQSKEVAAGVQFNQSLGSYFRIKKKSDSTPQIIFSNSLGTLESYTVGDLPWGNDPVQSVIGQGNALVLHEGAETPDSRGAPDINGYALFGGHVLMGCSNSGGSGSGLEDCYCMSAMDQFDRTLDFDPETGDVYDFVTKRRRRRRGHRHGHDMHLHTPNPHLRDLDPTLNLDPETGKPYTEDDLIVEIDLEGRAITYGAPVDYTVNPPTGNSWSITMNRHPNGQNGASLNQARGGTTDLYGAASCGDCGDIGASSSSDDPDSRPVSEHIHERQTEARAQEFMMSRRARMGDSTLVTSSHPAVPRLYLDPNSYLFTDYATWDPNGPSTITVGQTQIPVTGRPIDMITNAYGSDTNLNMLVNADSVLNGYKARGWVGHQPMSDDTWNSNGFDLADVDRTTGAITTIRTTMQVMSYLNDARVTANWATVVNTAVAIYDDYQNRVQRVDNVSIFPRQMYQEYILRVVIPDIENMEIWVTRRINQLRALWQPLVGQNSWAQLILDELEGMQEDMDTLILDFTNVNLGLD